MKISKDGKTLLQVDDGVTHLVLPPSVKTIKHKAINKNIISIKATGVININNRIFEGCTKLEYVDMPNVKIIKPYAFCNCIKLQYINVDCCEKIDTYAFCNCCSLTLFNGQLVKYIGYGAFRYCEKLKSIKTPKLKNIITDALEYCQNLINIESLLSDDQLKNAFSDNELYTKYKQRDRNIKISKLIQN